MYQEWGWESGVFLNNGEEKSQKILSLINERACHTRVVNVTKWQWRWKLTRCEIRWEAAVTGLLWGIAVFLQLRCLITICPCICSLCRARGGNRGGIRVSKKMLDTNHLRCMMINEFSLITIQCLSITVETKYGGQIETKLEKVANIL